MYGCISNLYHLVCISREREGTHKDISCTGHVMCEHIVAFACHTMDTCTHTAHYTLKGSSLTHEFISYKCGLAAPLISVMLDDRASASVGFL